MTEPLLAQDVVVRQLTDQTELVATERLYAEIWRSSGNTPRSPPSSCAR